MMSLLMELELFFIGHLQICRTHGAGNRGAARLGIWFRAKMYLAGRQTRQGVKGSVRIFMTFSPSVFYRTVASHRSDIMADRRFQPSPYSWRDERLKAKSRHYQIK